MTSLHIISLLIKQCNIHILPNRPFKLKIPDKYYINKYMITSSQWVSSSVIKTRQRNKEEASEQLVLLYHHTGESEASHI